MKNKSRILIIVILFINMMKVVDAQLVVSPITTSQLQLIQNIVNSPGALISNISYNGSGLPVIWNNIGLFSTGSTATNLGVNNGLILSTGDIVGAMGPNNSGSTTVTVLPSSPDLSDIDLEALVPGYTLHDAAILEFDFRLVTDTFKVRYVFGSDEYPEYANSNFNDVFGFFISGLNPSGPNYVNKNIAVLPGTTTPVTINSINNGNANSGPCINCSYYVNNVGGVSIQADGLTTVLTAWCLVVPCTPYHFKLAIADRADKFFDSWVWLEAAPPLLDSSSITGPATVCQGQQNVTYSVPVIPNFTQFNWNLPPGATGSSNTNSITVNYSNTAQSGFIKVIGYSTCGYDTLLSFPIIVKPKPNTPVIALSGDTLFSNAPAGNQWYSQQGMLSGGINQSYHITNNGTYYDIVTINGCTSDTSNNIIYTGMGINSAKAEDFYVKIKPNPAKDILTIETNSNTKQSLEIVSLLGELMYTYQINNKATVDVSAFPKGIYLIKIKTEKGIVVEKFIKE